MLYLHELLKGLADIHPVTVTLKVPAQTLQVSSFLNDNIILPFTGILSGMSSLNNFCIISEEIWLPFLW